MRMLAGANIAEKDSDGQADIDWSQTVAGPWLAETLAALRRPDGLARIDPGKSLQGSLRSYQLAGVQWLYLLTQLRLGACLADDMGLGKTIQILSLLLVLKSEIKNRRRPSLLVAPASLLANWFSEIARFAPDLKARVAHPSAAPAEQLSADDAGNPDADVPADTDLVLTTYGFLARSPRLATVPWRLVVLDEAQAIKNPAAKQTRTVKQLQADTRIALTGTPV